MKKFWLIIIILFLFVDAYFIEPQRLVEKHQKLYLPNWEKSIDGMKIAVVSDFHIGTRYSDVAKLDKIVKKINKQNPDVIFIVGDYDAKYIDKNSNPKAVSKALKNFKSKYGVISVLGNHDYYPLGVVENCLKNTDITLLENENKYLNYNGQKIKITGLKDYWYYPMTSPSDVIGKIDTPTIVLSHNPDMFPVMPKGVSLVLSGHTHGGEIRIPFFGSPFVPSDYGQRYCKGHIIENGKHLFVTSGTGTLSRMRFSNPPEIVYLTLYSEEKYQKDTKNNFGFKRNYIPIYEKLLKVLF